ncbi:2-succinyl-5-enolpyruvyl-6-hydroxy-3-cyclohexene-1-carboxylate synthase [Peribacillus deserti]|uniref:2-succinyl-5-enolpyruvyl-6-hydroxy-3-cyclohexene-1-carboxylate synthase n=1 Tax=Peribacillus deserti TaxID=673318 RepID=A0ABS2QIK2_9BACI|nr:2-succinyl-5-enolpyruvyl-6-hydroxy-3-cyclohexene-1-carboxylic-acid synthase [Peribacillus deserti]MBM7692987.1 2-succinyl-5-enolpyruvyl-6-hydroxy-3-cyclohexene-1-carboxylate synthase [Peribacillus deserti]
MQHREALTAYTGAFVDELAKVQIKHVVVSPGSRSTPLAYMLMEHPHIQVHMNIDERSAGFFALGLAKASKSPVGLLCTSGTAAANYFPAIVEAFNSRIPLLVMTADRPHELRDVGAPQAIDQIHLYGKHAKWFVEMALPESTEESIRYARTICARAAATAVSAPAGPVHLNFPFREPLIPYLNEPKWFGVDPGPSIIVEQSVPSLPEDVFKLYAERIAHAEKGLIICGGTDSEEFNSAVISLSEKIGFPILADPLSQLRSGSVSSEMIIDTYDTFLRYEEVKENLKPDLILRFGAMPVSKALTIFLKEQKNSEVLVIDGGAGWREPTGTAAAMIYCDETVFCRNIANRIRKSSDGAWMEYWKRVRDYTKEGLSRIRDRQELDEGKLFALLNDLMPDGSSLFVGNSMPVRDLDTFFHSSPKKVRLFCNRGANGIDGVVSTALGVSAVVKKAVLVIGDLSFFHDMNGLLAAKLLELNLTIVVLNNDGGGIFSFLPQSNDEKHYEALFGTPHGLDFQHAAQLYGANYSAPKNWDEFSDAFTSSFTKDGLKVIEVKTARKSNVQKHRDLWKDVSREINSLLNEEK